MPLDQSTDNQLLDLRRYASDRGWSIYKEYCDSGISGTKTSRPALDQLMDDAKKRRFDGILVWRFDRFARSTKHLILALEEFRNLGIDFVSYQENIDTFSPLGSALFTIISAVAQLERDIIAERVRAGLRRVVETASVDRMDVSRLHSQGLSQRAIAAQLGISHTTVGGILRTGRKTL